MTRRAPAPKADRERARIAGEYADEMYQHQRAYGPREVREYWVQSGGAGTAEYVEALRAAHDAAEVAADAFEVAHQDRKARSYRARAKRIRKMLASGTPHRDPPARRRPSDRPRSAEGNENLAYLLDRDVRAIGPESATAPPTRDVRLLISPSGSYRYVGLENGRAVSALQIQSRDGVRGVVMNVYTTPAARRRGWAARLLEVARKRFREVKHADDLSSAGKAWAERVRDPGGEEEGENWPLTEEKRKLLLHHIEAAERAEVDADLEETRDDLSKARYHAREAGVHYREAADVAAVPTVHNRADLRRHNERIELLERAYRSFRRGRSHVHAERVGRLIQSLSAFGRRSHNVMRDADYRGQKVPLDFARAAYEARRQRPGALEVLRDGIEEWFPKQYAAAVADAEHHWSETRMPYVVLFNARVARARFRRWQDARSTTRTPFDIQTAASIARNGMPPYSAIIWPRELVKRTEARGN